MQMLDSRGGGAPGGTSEGGGGYGGPRGGGGPGPGPASQARTPVAAGTTMSPSDAGPRRLLVTGGAGFIGGNFVHQVLADPDVAVLDLDLLTYAGHPATLRDLEGDARHRFVRGDIGDRDLVARLLAEFRPDAIVNFAAESHVDRSIDGPAAFIQTNVTGTFNLLDCARGYWRELPDEERRRFRFLHVSTDEVYGSLGPPATSPKRRPTPRARPTPRRRRRPTISSAPGTTPTACRC